MTWLVQVKTSLPLDICSGCFPLCKVPFIMVLRVPSRMQSMRSSCCNMPQEAAFELMLDPAVYNLVVVHSGSLVFKLIPEITFRLVWVWPAGLLPQSNLFRWILWSFLTYRIQLTSVISVLLMWDLELSRVWMWCSPTLPHSAPSPPLAHPFLAFMLSPACQ